MSWRLLTAIVAALLTLGLAAGVVACGQGGKGSEAPSPVAMNEVAKGFLPFTSSSKGYSIAYPESWWVQEDAGSFGGVSVDAFSAPPEDTGTPNASVLCSPIAEGTTTEELYAGLGPEVEVVGQVSMEGSGVSLDIVDRNAQDGVLDYAQVAVAEGECSWVITLVTSQGSRGEYLDIFIQMVQSFQAE